MTSCYEDGYHRDLLDVEDMIAHLQAEPRIWLERAKDRRDQELTSYQAYARAAVEVETRIKLLDAAILTAEQV